MKKLNNYITEKLKLKNVVKSYNYIKFEALENSTIGFFTTKKIVNLEYSYNKNDWNDWWQTKKFADIELEKDECLYIRGFNKEFSSEEAQCSFEISGKVKLSGNIMSLIYGNNTIGKYTIPTSGCFNSLFSDSTGLYDASEFELPATNLTKRCYHGMFRYCNNLVKGPKILPATNLIERCYGFMFVGCESLEEAPDLPATELVNSCYRKMFKNCIKLKNKPKLSVDITDKHECIEMFMNCPCENT